VKLIVNLKLTIVLQKSNPVDVEILSLNDQFSMNILICTDIYSEHCSVKLSCELGIFVLDWKLIDEENSMLILM
jgi:hypothetical protein